MNQRSLFRCVLAMGFTLFLFGCGTDDESGLSSSSPVEVFPIVALDGLSVADPHATAHIDLEPYVRGGKATLKSVRYAGVDEECNPPIPNGLGFDVETQSGSLCHYQFTVSNAQTNDSALMAVFSTEASDPILPPLSHAMIVNEADVSFELPILLGSDWPVGYSLVSESVVVQGSEGNLGSVMALGNTITYSGPDLSGWNRIIYTLTNTLKPNENIMGTVYTTISESINEPPEISNLKYHYNVENNNEIVYTGDQVNIDLTSFISESDGQEWQLIEVQSYTAMAVPRKENSITNKNIFFSSDTVGDHIISYVVADHFGGYSGGLIKVTVEAKEKAVTWDSLNVGEHYYTAPLIYSEGLNLGLNVTPEWDSGVSNTIAGYNIISAQMYCSTLGFIPTISEIEGLKKAHDTAASGKLEQWPTGKSYLVRNNENTEYVAYDITTGDINNLNMSEPYYITCLMNPNLSLSMKTLQLVANNEVVIIGTISKAPLTEVVLTKIATGKSNDLSYEDVDIKVTGSGSQLTITTQSKKSGVYRFKVTNSDDEYDSVASPIITYNADLNTARLISLTVDTYKAKSDAKSENKLTATVLDENKNPVPYQTLTVELIEKGSLALTASLINLPSTLITDSNGEVNLVITDSEVESVDVLTRYSGVASSENGITELTSTIKFTLEHAYCHQYPEVDSFNCLPYFDLPSGKRFTASPSMEWLNAVFPDINVIAINQEVGHGYASFGRFNKAAAHELCDKYSNENMFGRTDWRLATKDEIKIELYNYNSAPYDVGWPVSFVYSVIYPTPSVWYYTVEIKNDWRVRAYDNNVSIYVSCVSG